MYRFSAIRAAFVLSALLGACSVRAQSTADDRPLTSLAEREYKTALIGRHVVEHEPNRKLSKIVSTLENHYLLQMIAEEGHLHRYAMSIDVDPSQYRVDRLEPAPNPVHSRGAIFPSLTPWVEIQVARGSDRPLPLLKEAGKAWRERRNADVLIFQFAVARRRVKVVKVGLIARPEPSRQPPPILERAVRVQRFFRRSTMRQQISVTLAQENQCFNLLRISRNGKVGWLKMNDDVLTFFADQNHLTVTTAQSEAITFEIKDAPEGGSERLLIGGERVENKIDFVQRQKANLTINDLKVDSSVLSAPSAGADCVTKLSKTSAAP